MNLMTEKELKALVSLLDEEDKEVLEMVEQKIYSLGASIIPYLEDEWSSQFKPEVQKRIEDMIHALQYDKVIDRLRDWKDRGAAELLQGMWAVATYQYPDLEEKTLRAQIDHFYFDVWQELRDDLHPFDQVRIINSILFGKLKFKANTANFHAVANSMLNIVLESRRGNPITLCIVYLLIAEKLKLPIHGVNLPNLFILTYKTTDLQFYINAFNKGLIFSRTDIDNYIAQLNLTPNDTFYEPCTNLEIVKRVLRNLIVSFEKLGEADKVEEVKKLLAVIEE